MAARALALPVSALDQRAGQACSPFPTSLNRSQRLPTLNYCVKQPSFPVASSAGSRQRCCVHHRQQVGDVDATSLGAAPQCHPPSPYRGVILSPREIEALRIAASHGERGTRNVAMVLVPFATALAFQGLCGLRVRDLVAAYGLVLKEAPLLPGRGGRSRSIVWRSKHTVETVGLYPARRPDHACRAPHRGLDPDAPLFVSDAKSGHARIDEVWIPELFRGMSSAHASAPRRARSAE